MSLFYFDDTIKSFEQKLNYTPVINYLEEKYRSAKDIKIFITLVANSWYYLVEGDVNKTPVEYDWKFFLSKFKFYIDAGLKLYSDDERFLFVAGYVLDLHWIYLGKEYEGVGLKLMHKCSGICKDNHIKALVSYYLNRAKIPDGYVSGLFPSQSELDRYFSQIFHADGK